MPLSINRWAIALATSRVFSLSSVARATASYQPVGQDRRGIAKLQFGVSGIRRHLDRWHRHRLGFDEVNRSCARSAPSFTNAKTALSDAIHGRG